MELTYLIFEHLEWFGIVDECLVQEVEYLIVVDFEVGALDNEDSILDYFTLVDLVEESLETVDQNTSIWFRSFVNCALATERCCPR